MRCLLRRRASAKKCPSLIIFFSAMEQKRMAACQQSLPGTPLCTPPPTAIWVKRWELSWVQTDVPCEGAPCSWQQVATCTWQQGDVALPALADWPRWKPGPSNLPLDEYYRLSWVPQFVCPDPQMPVTCLDYCGLQQDWQPVWTRIETPRAWRWVSACPPACAPPVDPPQQ